MQQSYQPTKLPEFDLSFDGFKWILNPRNSVQSRRYVFCLRTLQDGSIVGLVQYGAKLRRVVKKPDDMILEIDFSEVTKK